MDVFVLSRLEGALSEKFFALWSVVDRGKRSCHEEVFDREKARARLSHALNQLIASDPCPSPREEWSVRGQQSKYRLARE